MFNPHSRLRRRRLHRPQAALAAAIFSAALPACGGGGDVQPQFGDAAIPAVAATVDTTSNLSAAAAERSVTTNDSCGAADVGFDAVALLNARRSAGAQCGSMGPLSAAAPLRWNDTLRQAALLHSDDMVASNFFAHAGSDGSDAGTRAEAAGYVSSSWAENIGAGPSTVGAVVDGWMRSDGHCANIMNAAMRDVGLACVSGSAVNAYRSYWTLVLASPR